MGAQWPRLGAQSGTHEVRPGQVSPVLIGRDDLVAHAQRRLHAAASGSGELLFLAGEAGIGKTRLLTEIVGRATTLGFLAVGAAAFLRDAEVAGGLLDDLSVDLQRHPGTSDIGRRISQRLAGVGTAPTAGAPGDAHRRRRVLVADLATLILQLGSGPRPVLITLEDLHWVDDSTLDVLDRVARGIGIRPLMVVGTYRSDELYPRLPVRSWRSRLLTQRLAEEVRLTRLSASDTAAMTAAISQDVLPAAVSSAVYARSDGIPLHVEEFLAGLNVTGAGAGLRVGVPDTLADAVLARADLLTPQARTLAGAASVIGRSFDVDLLAGICAQSEAEIDLGLRELTDRFFVTPRTSATSVPGPQPVPVRGRDSRSRRTGNDQSVYDFRHALIRDALYADLTPHRRRELHSRTADAAIVAGFGDAFVSDQYERANRPTEAHRGALAAAAGAAAMSAHREAVLLYRRAQRTAPADSPDGDRADLLAALAAELSAVDDNSAAVDAYEQAFTLRSELGAVVAAAALVPALVAAAHLLGADLTERTARLRGALSALASIDNPAAQDVRRQIYAALAAAYMLDRRLDEAIDAAERARHRPDTVTDGHVVTDADTPVELATRCNLDATLGSVLVFAGRMDEGWQLLEDAVGTADRARLESEAARGYRMMGTSASVLVEYDRAMPWLTAGIEYAGRTERFNDQHYMAAHAAHVHWAVGDWAVADPMARQALADGADGVTTRITALYVLGYLAMGRGEWLEAQRRLTEAAELGTGMNELQRMSPAWWGMAENALLQGRHTDSIGWCERGFRASVTVQDAAYLFPYVITGVRAHLLAGDPTAAEAWRDRCVPLLINRNIPGTLGVLDHTLGLLQLHRGQTGKARESLFRAGEFWSARRRFWEGTYALLDQARCAARSRRPAYAAELADRARERAVAAGATTVLLAAESLPTEEVQQGVLAVLTARESEVAALVATGATNRQIAESLSIAPKTVAAHVEHILTKLGAARRAQIATWVSSR